MKTMKSNKPSITQMSNITINKPTFSNNLCPETKKNTHKIISTINKSVISQILIFKPTSNNKK